MPEKKRTNFDEPLNLDPTFPTESFVAVEPTKAEEKKASTGGGCGFENKQYFSGAGRKMTCTLAKGHEGDHSAPSPEEGADKEILIGFSDAAGVPIEAGELKKLEVEKARKEAAKK